MSEHLKITTSNTLRVEAKRPVLVPIDENAKKSFSRQELKDLSADFLCRFYGDIPKNLDDEKQQKWLRDDGLISLLIDSIYG